jgi:hypothetical protein
MGTYMSSMFHHEIHSLARRAALPQTRDGALAFRLQLPLLNAAASNEGRTA